MEFCPKCGCVIVEKNKKFICPRCNYKSKTKIKIEVSENIQKTPRIGIITDKDTDVFPIINAICPKCNHKEAYFFHAFLPEAEVLLRQPLLRLL